MAVILNSSLFIHIPKTGGTWVMDALAHAGLAKGKGKPGTKHASLHELRYHYLKTDFSKLRAFCFVRNPITWWQSRWSDPYHREHYQKNLTPDTIKWCGNIKWMNHETMIQNDEQFEDFNVYMESILERRPGFCSEYLRFMTNVKKIEIGRYEHIVNDLVEILYRCGENFLIEDIKGTPRTNESDPVLDRGYTEENLSRVIAAEKEAMEKYKYSMKLEDYTHLMR